DKQSRRRKTWWKLAPQQVIVMLWIQILSGSTDPDRGDHGV
ncbi:hypothetical protein AB205_0219870, partial [Aquarana catesbeiana]